MFQILCKTVYKETYCFGIFPCCGHHNITRFCRICSSFTEKFTAQKFLSVTSSF